MGHFMGNEKKPRLPPSFGNPGHVTGEVANTEDDILHIRHLPDFQHTVRIIAPRTCAYTVISIARMCA